MNNQETIKWLRTQLKPEYKDKEITVREGEQTSFFLGGLLLAYRSSMWLWCYRGNTALINSATAEELEANHNRPTPEYYTYP